MWNATMKDGLTNVELRSRLELEHISEVMKTGRWHWLDHEERKDENDWAKDGDGSLEGTKTIWKILVAGCGYCCNQVHGGKERAHKQFYMEKGYDWKQNNDHRWHLYGNQYVTKKITVNNLYSCLKCMLNNLFQETSQLSFSSFYPYIPLNL